MSRFLHYLLYFCAVLFIFSRVIIYYPLATTAWAAPEANRLSSSSMVYPLHTIANTPATGCSAWPGETQDAEIDQELVYRTNLERQAAGLPPLKRTPSLDSAARTHASDMAQDEYFNHDTYDRIDGQLLWVCAWYTRISAVHPAWLSLGENIAVGYPDPASVMAAWMASPGHRANILSPDFYELGVGLDFLTSPDPYWVQDFARSSGVFPLIINLDAETSTTSEVSLYIYGQWSEVRFNPNNTIWSDWKPFQNNMPYTLPAEDGLASLAAEMRTASSSASAQDTIWLDLPSDPVPVPELSGLPAQISFMYSSAEDRFYPTSITLQPANAADATPIEWQVTWDSGLFIIDPTTGTTPGSLTITPVSGTLSIQSVPPTETITIAAISPELVTGSPQEIEVTITSVTDPVTQVFLPFVRRDP